MSRIAFVNGRYVPHAKAMVHVEDRGYLFADGVYEGISVCNGLMVDESRHMQRLWRSLSALGIEAPCSEVVLSARIQTVIRKNRLKDGLVYFQVTRGVARRDFPFPAATRPSLVIMVLRKGWRALSKAAETGVSTITYPDQRWARRDIKSLALLPSVLAKQAAVEAGAFEAIMVEAGGFVTEGGSSTVWIVTHDDKLITRPYTQTVLPGVTRLTVQDIAGMFQLQIEERPYTVDELKAAREVFITSASCLVLPVVKVDDHQIDAGVPGPVTQRLRTAYLEAMDAGELV